MLGFFFSTSHTTAALRAAEILTKILLHGAAQWKRPGARRRAPRATQLGCGDGRMAHGALRCVQSWF